MRHNVSGHRCTWRGDGCGHWGACILARNLWLMATEPRATHQVCAHGGPQPFWTHNTTMYQAVQGRCQCLSQRATAKLTLMPCASKRVSDRPHFPPRRCKVQAGLIATTAGLKGADSDFATVSLLMNHPDTYGGLVSLKSSQHMLCCGQVALQSGFPMSAAVRSQVAASSECIGCAHVDHLSSCQMSTETLSNTSLPTSRNAGNGEAKDSGMTQQASLVKRRGLCCCSTSEKEVATTNAQSVGCEERTMSQGKQGAFAHTRPSCWGGVTHKPVEGAAAAAAAAACNDAAFHHLHDGAYCYAVALATPPPPPTSATLRLWQRPMCAAATACIASMCAR